MWNPRHGGCRRRAFALAAACAALLVAPAAGAGANPKAPQPLRELAYLIGEWEVTSFTRNDEGSFVATPIKSRFRARWLHDGHAILHEHFEEDPDGFYGVNVVTWDPDTRQLVFSFFNAKKNRRREFRGGIDDGVLRVANRGGYGGTGSHLYRESDTRLDDGSFEKRLHRSDDDGATWKELDFMFRYRKLPPAAR